MIRAVRCDQPSFKEVIFKPGFNVVLAERTQESTIKDSRNGLGKTTLLEIIDFCLCANTSKDQGLRREPLLGWVFSIDIEISGQIFTFHRNTANPNKITIEGDCTDWPIKPDVDLEDKQTMSYRKLRIVLGYLFFKLDVETQTSTYVPSFRSLISYFIRIGHDAFSTPFEHFRKQLEWDKQVNNAFLLDLGWEYAQKWQILKDKNETIRRIKKTASPEFMPNLVGTIGELENSRVRLQERSRKYQTELESFLVHPQYKEIEQKASSLTKEIHDLSNGNFQDRKLLEYYQTSLLDDPPASPDSISSMYEEAGLVLPDNITKRLDDVIEFHSRVNENRRLFLQSEIQNLNTNLQTREQQIQDLTRERASLLNILQTHGALEEYTELQKRHLQVLAELEDITTRIKTLREFEREKSALNIEIEQLTLAARADTEERQTSIQKAISIFNAYSETMYEAPGKLIVDVERTGFKFQVEIERALSQGFGKMKVFCYDLMLSKLWSDKISGPGFLVHDSTIFDGVDERQVAHALQLASKESADNNYQYICTFNSDLIPWNDFDKDFDLNKYVRLILTDADENGGLLGIRF